MTDTLDEALRRTRTAVPNEDDTISPANSNWHKGLIPAGNAAAQVLVQGLEAALKKGNIKLEDLE